MTLIEFYKILGASIKPGLEDRLDFFISNSKGIYHPFPSVTKGPVRVEKLRQLCQFEPSQVDEVFARSVRFYQEAFFKFENMRHLVEKELKKDILKSEEERENLKKFIRDYSKK